MADWSTEARNADETLDRSKQCAQLEYILKQYKMQFLVQNSLKAMLRKISIFKERGRNNDKPRDMIRLWNKVTANYRLTASNISVLDDVFITRGTGKGTLQYIDRTAPDLSHADCADLSSTRYSPEQRLQMTSLMTFMLLKNQFSKDCKKRTVSLFIDTIYLNTHTQLLTKLIQELHLYIENIFWMT